MVVGVGVLQVERVAQCFDGRQERGLQLVHQRAVGEGQQRLVGDAQQHLLVAPLRRAPAGAALHGDQSAVGRALADRDEGERRAGRHPVQRPREHRRGVHADHRHPPRGECRRQRLVGRREPRGGQPGVLLRRVADQRRRGQFVAVAQPDRDPGTGDQAVDRQCEHPRDPVHAGLERQRRPQVEQRLRHLRRLPLLRMDADAVAGGGRLGGDHRQQAQVAIVEAGRIILAQHHDTQRPVLCDHRRGDQRPAPALVLRRGGIIHPLRLGGREHPSHQPLTRMHVEIVRGRVAEAVMDDREQGARRPRTGCRSGTSGGRSRAGAPGRPPGRPPAPCGRAPAPPTATAPARAGRPHARQERAAAPPPPAARARAPPGTGRCGLRPCAAAPARTAACPPPERQRRDQHAGGPAASLDGHRGQLCLADADAGGPAGQHGLLGQIDEPADADRWRVPGPSPHARVGDRASQRRRRGTGQVDGCGRGRVEEIGPGTRCRQLAQAPRDDGEIDPPATVHVSHPCEGVIRHCTRKRSRHCMGQASPEQGKPVYRARRRRFRPYTSGPMVS